MKRFLLLSLALLLFAFPAHALTGKVLVIVCDKPGAAANASAYQANNIFSRVAYAQGLEYETCMSSDTAYTNALYETHPIATSSDTVAGGVRRGKYYGRYDMAVMLNMPNPAWLDTDAKCVTYNMPHFCHWVNRNNLRVFPIPLLIPIAGAGMTVTNKLAPAFTGAISATAFTSGKGEPYTDANGDSLYLYTPTGKSETLVINSDSATFSW